MISVIIPAYKAEKQILACMIETTRALRSFDKWEIVVSIDGENDSTFDIATKFSEKFKSNEQNFQS